MSSGSDKACNEWNSTSTWISNATIVKSLNIFLPFGQKFQEGNIWKDARSIENLKCFYGLDVNSFSAKTLSKLNSKNPWYVLVNSANNKHD